MGIKQKLIAQLRETSGMSHADAKRVVEERRQRPVPLTDKQPRILHLDQILIAVAKLPQQLHLMRHRGTPTTFEVSVNSWRILDAAIPPNGVPLMSVPEQVVFTRDRRGDWRFEGRVAVINMELPPDTMPADEAVRAYARQKLDRLTFDGIVRIAATAQPMNQHHNIPIDLVLDILGPSPGSVLAQDHNNTRLIDFDAKIECVPAHPVVFDEPQPSLVEHAGVLYVDFDARTEEKPEAYEHQNRKTLRDCKPGDIVFAPVSGGATTWHPLRIAFGCPSS